MTTNRISPIQSCTYIPLPALELQEKLLRLQGNLIQILYTPRGSTQIEETSDVLVHAEVTTGDSNGGRGEYNLVKLLLQGKGVVVPFVDGDSANLNLETDAIGLIHRVSRYVLHL